MASGRLRSRAAPVLPIAAALLAAPLAHAGDLVFACKGEAAPESHAASSGAVAFKASAHFGEGDLLALADPETKQVARVLYDAEVVSGALTFDDGSEAAIVWTRLSGATGPLVGQAVASDGDALALSIGAGASDAPRAFALFR